MIKYNRDGSKEETTYEYTYDDHGVYTVRDEKKDGVLTTHTEYAAYYNVKDGKWDNYEVYRIIYENGEVESKNVYIYTQHGEKVTQFESAAADPKTSSEAVYEFDAGGNMTSCTVYKDPEHTNIDIKWTGIYDAGGNLIKEVQENYFQGELSATTTREYDAQGRMLSSMKVVRGKKGASGEEYTYEGDLVEYKTKKLYDEGYSAKG